MVCEHRTKLGTPTAMTQNPHNAIIHLGHNNGTVTLWSPNMPTPLVKMFTHKGPVQSISIDREGKYMVSTGTDYRVRIFDIRNYKEIHSYYTQRPANEVAISEMGLLGIGWGGHVSVYPYFVEAGLIIGMERCLEDKATISVHDSSHSIIDNFLSPFLSLRRCPRRRSLYRLRLLNHPRSRRTQL